MNVYNSAGGFNEDDQDMTMINHSFLYSGNDESINSCIPIVRRQQQTKTNSEDSHVNQDPLGAVHQIEQILNFYRQDLKQDSMIQLDCDRQLITRLIDFLRPSYSSNENHMKELDILYREIFDLQEIRFAEQQEKNDQLSIQIRYLKKSIITSPIEDDDRNSMMANIYRMNTMFDYDQWIEVEEETKQLQQLVKAQQERIDQLVELISSVDPEQLVEEKPPSIENIESSEMPKADHVEEYSPTSDTAVPTRREQLECPFCDVKFPNDDDISYIEHLSRCFNNENENS